MEGTSDRDGERIFMDRLRSTVGQACGMSHFAKARREPQGCDRGVRGTVASGARGRKRRAPTRSDPPKRIGRREPPGPPVSIIQGASPAAKGRGASLEEMLGTNAARVLVVESSGKQKSVERIGLVLHVLSQGRP
jgi:hypothetical protein